MFSLNSRKEKKQKQDCTTLPKGNKIMPQLTNETMKVRDENTHKKIKGLTPSNYIRYILVYIYTIYIHILTDI